MKFRWLLALAAALLSALAHADTEWLQLPATARRPALSLFWSPADTARRPAVVALHGCGGLFRKDGHTFDTRFANYTDRLHDMGFHVLLPDSFGSRGLGSLCEELNAARSVYVADRRLDVLEALAWLRARPDVDPERIALLGWSNGASTALMVMDSRWPPSPPPLAAVALFYPGCSASRGGEPKNVGALLMLLGGADDMTPPEPCEQLAARWQRRGHRVELEVYPGAFHGFDGDGALRVRPNIKGGMHQGNDPAAAAASATRLEGFLRRQLHLPAQP
ncbi:dienelactone hydrolase family protein [Roseateles sp.]|uniref:dienelactone hydrolase family protein n=1 Tax=Roseateles sp. TaxID=1971397 RepID=UPI003922E5EA